MILRLVFAAIGATWVFWQIPFSSTAEIRLPEIVAYAAFPESVAASDKAPAAVFYRRTGVGQYKIFGLSNDGAIVRTLALPGEQIQKADQTSISLAGKEGYITAPENGAYFIWYPQLGQQVYVFNEQGSFLWEKEESHYLQVLPRGRYIMAAAGDHSRMIFMNPDFKTQADFQGVLFTRFIVDDNPDLKNGQVCLGSLDGEIIVAHIDRKIYMRQKLGYALKSLLCNFETSELAAIVERTVTVDKVQKQVDFLIRAKFALKVPKDEKPSETMKPIAAELDITGTLELPVRTVMASPMVLSDDTVCFLQSAPDTATATGTKQSTEADATDQLALYYTLGGRNKLQQATIGTIRSNAGAAQAFDHSPDLWKSTAIKLAKGSACLFAHRSGRLIVANERGILLQRTDMPVERLIGTGDAAFIQTPNGVLTLR